MGNDHCLCLIDFLTKTKAISKVWLSFFVLLSAVGLTMPALQGSCEVDDSINKNAEHALTTEQKTVSLQRHGCSMKDE